MPTAPRVLGGPPASPTLQEPRVTFDTGAQRSATMPRYDLIPQCALRRLAARFEMGLKYGEHNYKLGLPFDDTYNHILDHLSSYCHRRKYLLEHDHHRQEDLRGPALNKAMDEIQTDGDDLAAAMWGIVALMFFEER